MPMKSQTQHPLARFRAERGISQEDLARMLDVTVGVVSRWERGLQVPRRKLWPQIVHVTGVRPAELAEAAAEAAE